MGQDKEFAQRVQRLERLIQEIDALPQGRAREAVVEIVQEVLALHGAGLEQMLDLIHAAPGAGSPLIDRLAADRTVSAVLLLHGLHPIPLEARVDGALEKVRPYLGTHGGNVEVLGLKEGVLRLRLQGSCNGCASSAVTLKLAIEQALNEAAPDLNGLQVEGVVEQPRALPAGFIPLTAVGAPRPAPPASAEWQPLHGLDGLESGGVRLVEMGAVPLLVCRRGDSLYAYGAVCPACTRSLAGASLDDATLSCPACKTSFDVVRAGRALERPDLHLDPVPLLHEVGGRPRVAVPAMSR